MNAPEWYETNPARWQAEQDIARGVLRGFQAGVDGKGRAFLAGEVSLLSDHGHEYGPFGIRIVYPVGFPERGRVPAVYLESHRDQWKNVRDSHIEADWTLCLFVPGESQIDFTRSNSVGDLLACLGTFLLKERLYQQALAREALTGLPARWLGHQRSHGRRGIREAVRDRGRVGRNEACICGSGKKFKNCCLDKMER
jgi:hypothetical protein